jgi:hypothetical protein
VPSPPGSRGTWGIGELRELGPLKRGGNGSGRQAVAGRPRRWRGEPARRGWVGGRMRHEEAAIRLRLGSFHPDNLDPGCSGGTSSIPFASRDIPPAGSRGFRLPVGCRNPFMQLVGDTHGAGHPGGRSGTQGAGSR